MQNNSDDKNIILIHRSSNEKASKKTFYKTDLVSG